MIHRLLETLNSTARSTKPNTLSKKQYQPAPKIAPKERAKKKQPLVIHIDTENEIIQEILQDSPVNSVNEVCLVEHGNRHSRSCP